MTKHLTKLLLACAACVTLAPPASAGNQTYEFSIDWRSGTLDGTSSAGSFSFDESLAVANQSYTSPDLLQSFDLVAGGKHYSAQDVSTAVLWFDSAAHLKMIMFGTDCAPNACTATAGDPHSLYISYFSESRLDPFTATLGGPTPQQSRGVGLVALAAVPEPSTVSLAAVGMLGAFLCLRRQARPRSAHAA